MHAFTFFRAGGFDQVRLSTAADIAAIGELDRTLWAVLACPVRGLEFDERTLALIDGDGDSRVRLPEVIAAVRWAQERLTDLGLLLAGRERLPLAAIVPGTPVGQVLLGCARRVLERAGQPAATDIGLGEIEGAAGNLAKTRFNGDGVLPPSAAGDPLLAQAISDIIAIRTATIDRGGEAGLDRAGLAAFLADATAWLAWWDGGQHRSAELLPAGEATPAAFAALEAVRGKIDDFFLRCRATAFDPRAAGLLARGEAAWSALAGKDLGAALDEVGVFPLAAIGAGASLPLGVGVNPAWAGRIADLRRHAIEPILGPCDVLDEGTWRELCARLEAFRAWRATEAGIATGKLGASRLRELVAPTVKAGLDELFRLDEVMKPEFEAINDLERLVRYHRDLFRLLQNFVNMADFYDPAWPAVFQCGTLFFDGRAMDLCVRVADQARHGQLAARSNSCLLYCECTRPGETMTVCAAVTNGGTNGLIAGRNGLFVDRKGRDWDATVVKVVENPISVRAAFWSPYTRLIRFVEDFAAKRAAEADQAADTRLSSLATVGADAAQKGTTPRPKIDIGTVAALGVAVGGISAAIGALLSALFGLGFWIPLGLVGLVLAISGPSMVLAWLKLRTRNLGPILDANGWAVNGNVRINIRFGAEMTRVGALPRNAHRIHGDPFAERPFPWRLLLILLGLLLIAGWLEWKCRDAGCWPWQGTEQR